MSPTHAEWIAALAHGPQTDKSGKPQIDHVRRVARRTAELGGSPRAVALAWLHDVMEDTDADASALLNLGVPTDLVVDVDILTRSETETYRAYIGRIAAAPTDVLLVKVADLSDNLLRPGMDTLKPRYREALDRLLPIVARRRIRHDEA